MSFSPSSSFLSALVFVLGTAGCSAPGANIVGAAHPKALPCAAESVQVLRAREATLVADMRFRCPDQSAGSAWIVQLDASVDVAREVVDELDEYFGRDARRLGPEAFEMVGGRGAWSGRMSVKREGANGPGQSSGTFAFDSAELRAWWLKQESPYVAAR